MISSKSKLNQLEGLRGIAAFVVLIQHLQFTFFADFAKAAKSLDVHSGRPLATIAMAFFDGNFAVWLFWVMSAFVLSIRFHSSANSVDSYTLLADATVRRYPRLLLPVAASILFAWTLQSCGLITNVPLATLFGLGSEDWLGKWYLFEPNAASALKSAVWNTFFAYDDSLSYNTVLWTMRPELLGSLFLFAFLALFGKHHSRLVFYSAVLIVVFKLRLHWLNAFIAGTMLSDAYVHWSDIRPRCPVWLVAYSSDLLNKRWLSLLIALVLLYFIGLPNDRASFQLFLASIVVVFALLSPPASCVLSQPVFVFLGKISFGLYLSHVPLTFVLAMPFYEYGLSVTDHVTAKMLAMIAIVFVSIPVAWCFWLLADRPAIGFSRIVSDIINRTGLQNNLGVTNERANLTNFRATGTAQV